MINLLLATLVSFSALANKALESDMRSIARTYEQLGRQIDDPSKNESSRQLVQGLIDQSQNAKKHTPPNPQAKGAYQADMQEMISHLQSMNTALKANNNGEAKTHFEALKKWTTSQHPTKYQ